MSKLTRRKFDDKPASESHVPCDEPSSATVQRVGETVPFHACRDRQLSLSARCVGRSIMNDIFNI